jgi:DNA-binding transcriptional MerR regulator
MPSFCRVPCQVIRFLYGKRHRYGHFSLEIFSGKGEYRNGISIRAGARIFIFRGAAVIDQNYLQCHFFGPQTKDRDMHREKTKSGRMYRIGEAARALDLQTSVLRFWESDFPGLQPVRTPKGQRLYTEQDMELLRRIRDLLHEQGMTIEGARRVLSGAAAPQTILRGSKAGSAPAPAGHAETAAMLQDALRELCQIRALLTANDTEEKRS